MYGAHFIHPLILLQALAFHYSPLATVINAAMNRGVQILPLRPSFQIYPEVELLDHMLTIISLTLLSPSHTVFHSSCTILYSHQ
jgi:hypothetical protein